MGGLLSVDDTFALRVKAFNERQQIKSILLILKSNKSRFRQNVAMGLENRL